MVITSDVTSAFSSAGLHKYGMKDLKVSFSFFVEITHSISINHWLSPVTHSGQCLEVTQTQHASHLKKNWHLSGGLKNVYSMLLLQIYLIHFDQHLWNQHLFNNFVLIPAVGRKSSQKVGSSKLALKALFKTRLGGDQICDLYIWIVIISFNQIIILTDQASC